MNLDEVKWISGQHVYTMSCGQMMLKQKNIVHQQSIIDFDRYTAMFDCFIKESSHPGFEHFTPSVKCPQPEFIKDECHANNTDESVNPDVENVFVN